MQGCDSLTCLQALCVRGEDNTIEDVSHRKPACSFWEKEEIEVRCYFTKAGGAHIRDMKLTSGDGLAPEVSEAPDVGCLLLHP